MVHWYAAKARVSAKAVKIEKAFVWKEDIGETILEGLREDVVYRLRRASGWEVCGDEEEIDGMLSEKGGPERPDERSRKASREVVCLLKLSAEASTKPPRSAETTGTPIYDLSSLLDAASLARLCQLVPAWMDVKWVVMRRYNHSTGLAMALLKLKQYLAVPLVSSGGS